MRAFFKVYESGLWNAVWFFTFGNLSFRMAGLSQWLSLAPDILLHWLLLLLFVGSFCSNNSTDQTIQMFNFYCVW